MDKWMYERMTKENSEKSTEELTQEILALEEIECNDRYFANQCEAGNAIANINKLFEALNTMENVPNSVRLIIENAEISWEYITSGIAEMNNDSRREAALKDFKERVYYGNLYSHCRNISNLER